MKKIIVSSVMFLSACSTTGTICSNQYIANMYAKGTLNNYDETGTGCGENKNCPGCHVKQFDRVKLTVDEILDESARMHGIKEVDVCAVTIEDSLKLKNISETRYIQATDEYTCEMVYEKEKSYLKAMGFSE